MQQAGNRIEHNYYTKYINGPLGITLPDTGTYLLQI
jgi:hypothetical protein